MGNNLHVTGNLLIDGASVFAGTVDLAGGALDTDLVTNFNADLLDSAHKSTDGTLADNSDAKIPTEKAIKTYVDTLDGANVKLTGDQEIAGVKTFSSPPLLPADTVEEEDIQAGAVTEAKIGAGAVTVGKIGAGAVTAALTAALGEYASHDIGGSATWTPPAGVYVMAVTPNNCAIDIHGATWHLGAYGWAGGLLVCDGENVRLRAQYNLTVYYLPLV